MMTRDEERQSAIILGARLQLGWGQVYGDLKSKMQRLYADRIAKLPWVPGSWLNAMRDLQAKYPNDVVLLTPGRDLRGDRGADAPSFADTDEKLDVWNTIWKQSQDAVVAYGAGKAEEARQQLDGLYSAAGFWDAAYKTAKFVANLPGEAAKATAGAVYDVFGAFIPDALKAYTRVIFWGVLLLFVGAVFFWYRKRLAGLISGLKRGR